MTDEADISRKYRALGAEEPPRALDDAILAAARREAGAGPATLEARAARSGRQRWYAPLATAAVLVLAVAVTLNMQLERPGIESPATQDARERDAPSAAASPEASAELKLKATADLKVASKPAADAGAASARRKEAAQPAPAAPVASEPQPFAANRAAERPASRADDARDSRGPASNVTGDFARKMEERTSRDAEAGERAPQIGALGSLAKRAEGAAAGAAQAQLQERQAPPSAAPAVKPMQAAAPTPEQELERIAEMRRQGRHDEADKALAEFRKRYPEFRISDAMRERVERR